MQNSANVHTKEATVQKLGRFNVGATLALGAQPWRRSMPVTLARGSRRRHESANRLCRGNGPEARGSARDDASDDDVRWRLDRIDLGIGRRIDADGEVAAQDGSESEAVEDAGREIRGTGETV